MQTQVNRSVKIVFWSLILVLSALLLFLAAEIVLRLHTESNIKKAIEHYSSDNVFSARNSMFGNAGSVWDIKFVKYKQNAVLEFEMPDGEQFSFRTNSLGYRTPEFSSKQSGIFRIIAIGGSTTVQGLTNSTTYPALLEKELKTRYPNLNVEVLNLGVSASVSDVWHGQFKRLMSYEPDLILQYNAINDLRSHKLYEDYLQKHPWHMKLYFSTLLQKLFPIHVQDLNSAFQPTLDNFLVLRDMLQAEGVAYMTSTFAYPTVETASEQFEYYLDSEIRTWWGWGGGLRLAEYRQFQALLEAYNQSLRDFASENNLVLVDVQALVSSAEYFVDTCHMRPVGIELQAKAFVPHVEKLLKNKGLIP